MRRARRSPFLAASAAILLASGTSACSPSAVSCDDVCGCAGKSGDATCLTTCKSGQAAEEAQAAAARCTAAYRELARCESDNDVCDDAKKVYTYPDGVCDPLLAAYRSCAHLEATSSSAGTGG